MRKEAKRLAEKQKGNGKKSLGKVIPQIPYRNKNKDNNILFYSNGQLIGRSEMEEIVKNRSLEERRYEIEKLARKQSKKKERMVKTYE